MVRNDVRAEQGQRLSCGLSTLREQRLIGWQTTTVQSESMSWSGESITCTALPSISFLRRLPVTTHCRERRMSPREDFPWLVQFTSV
jgi:hypothetical protein